MELLVLFLFFLIAVVLSVFSKYMGIPFIALVGGAVFLIMGVVILSDGIDTEGGFNETSSTTTNNRTITFTNYKDRDTNVLGGLIVLVGLFVLIMSIYDLIT